MTPIEHFHFCPRCGGQRAKVELAHSFRCERCGFQLYFNPATAAAGILVAEDGRVLFVRRAKEPAKGKLAMPGGFVDTGETAEAALRRELREELNLEPGALEYLTSHPNVYPYQGVSYAVLDFFFLGGVQSTAKLEALDDVESYCWLEPAAVDPEEIAFPSMRAALQLYLTRSTSASK